MSRSACTSAMAFQRRKQDTPYKLKPDTEYTVRMATLSLDDPLDDEDSLTDVQLRDRIAGNRKDPTAAAQAAREGMPGHVLDFSRRIEAGGSALLPAWLLPLSGPAVEDQGSRPHLRADAGPFLRQEDRQAGRAFHGDGGGSDLCRHLEPVHTGRPRRYLRRVPGALPDRLRVAQHADPAEDRAQLHDPRRPRDRGQLDPGPPQGQRQASPVQPRDRRLHELPVEPRTAHLGPAALLHVRVRRLSVLRPRYPHAAVQGRQGRAGRQSPARPTADRQVEPRPARLPSRLAERAAEEPQERTQVHRHVERVRAQRHGRADP